MDFNDLYGGFNPKIASEQTAIAPKLSEQINPDECVINPSLKLSRNARTMSGIVVWGTAAASRKDAVDIMPTGVVNTFLDNVEKWYPPSVHETVASDLHIEAIVAKKGAIIRSPSDSLFIRGVVSTISEDPIARTGGDLVNVHVRGALMVKDYWGAILNNSKTDEHATDPLLPGESVGFLLVCHVKGFTSFKPSSWEWKMIPAIKSKLKLSLAQAHPIYTGEQWYYIELGTLMEKTTFRNEIAIYKDKDDELKSSSFVCIYVDPFKRNRMFW